MAVADKKEKARIYQLIIRDIPVEKGKAQINLFDLSGFHSGSQLNPVWLPEWNDFQTIQVAWRVVA